MQSFNRRVAGFALALLGPLSTLTGCETLDLRRPQREKDPDVAQTSTAGNEVESTKVLDVQSDPAKPRPFFRSSRLPGGLSDEAREIESHVGIQ